MTNTGLEVASLTDVTIVSKIQFVTLEVRVIEFKIFFWSVLEAIGADIPFWEFCVVTFFRISFIDGL